MYSCTTCTKKVAAMKKRIRAIQGGTSAGKTVSILLWLINLAQSDSTPTLTSIVSESFPHLKRGSMRDFLNIMQAHGYFKDDCWNKTESTYTFETGSKIEFFSADQPSKVRGPRRDRLLINEANNIPYEAFDQLEVRTKEFIYLDWNPTNEFWFYDQVLAVRTDVEHIIVNYKHNEGLSKDIIDSIEQRKGNKRWWRVYGEGLLGEVDGKIFTDWKILDTIPHEAKLFRTGIDFGYTNDPTSIVDVYEYDGGYILDEIAYQRGLKNNQIADILNNKEDKALVIAESAEPKSIDEIKEHGVMIVPCVKGKDSINQGIQYIQGLKISVTKRSLNIIKEYRNYLWMEDKDGKTLNVPEGGFDHSMDAIRYAFSLRDKHKKERKQHRPNTTYNRK